MADKEILPKVVFGIQVETVPELGGIALKIKHSQGPNASYGLKRLESHFAMPRAYAEDLRNALDQVLAAMPAGPLNS